MNPLCHGAKSNFTSYFAGFPISFLPSKNSRIRLSSAPCSWLVQPGGAWHGWLNYRRETFDGPGYFALSDLGNIALLAGYFWYLSWKLLSIGFPRQTLTPPRLERSNVAQLLPVLRSPAKLGPTFLIWSNKKRRRTTTTSKTLQRFQLVKTRWRCGQQGGGECLQCQDLLLDTALHSTGHLDLTCPCP